MPLDSRAPIPAAATRTSAMTPSISCRTISELADSTDIAPATAKNAATSRTGTKPMKT